MPEEIAKGAFTETEIKTALDNCQTAYERYKTNQDSNDKSTDLEKLGLNTTFFKDKNGDVAGIISKESGKLFICFIGNTKALDVLSDINIQSSSIGEGENAYHVHKGFHNFFKDREASMNKAIQELDSSNTCEKVFTGHSAGGAIAQIASLDRKLKHPKEKIKTITFGGPRVFFRNSAKKYRDLLGLDSLAIQNTSDLIVKLPPPHLFSHVSYNRIRMTTTKGCNHIHTPEAYQNICNEITQEQLNDIHHKAEQMKEREALGKEIWQDRKYRVKEAAKQISSLEIRKSLSTIRNSEKRNDLRFLQRQIDKDLKNSEHSR